MNKNIVPNLFTFANLTCGILAIIFTLSKSYTIAGILILLAALIDRYDGRVARKLNVSSPLGKELDSLADLVSFGAAPAIVMWSLSLQNLGVIGYIVTIIFPIAGAYRLARFNVTTFNNVFMGVPITIAGAIMAIDILIVSLNSSHTIVSAVMMLILSYLMVSTLQIKKF
ncbi:CDP-diacylglycerol--serine O-phosphatidyltransferase [Fervidicella metallireducens AeB]|uniref:CDP-diacylglycerol--serine O-phosphatidyltransferase n=1 Tax=Fervidicella metallireducens AeB TaxID=1403537 RepID=A0A017RYS3_9CLOT|nr:CDP-diacylglycerol--serine O-phosphatidyltransferase [Fervidicella metallireducens]EYE89055.1 CDP-diacylglycerol--serine O-phosphatidyltransferase [Fervidicella metallireducens AeB]